MSPKQIIAGIMDRIVDRPRHNMLASEIVKKLGDAGYVIVPAEPTNDMICGALEASLTIIAEKGVNGSSPFSDYPPPGEVTKRCYRAMIAASRKE